MSFISSKRFKFAQASQLSFFTEAYTWCLLAWMVLRQHHSHPSLEAFEEVDITRFMSAPQVVHDFLLSMIPASIRKSMVCLRHDSRSCYLLSWHPCCSWVGWPADCWQCWCFCSCKLLTSANGCLFTLGEVTSKSSMVHMWLDPSRTSKSTGLQTKAILSAVTNFESCHCSNGKFVYKRNICLHFEMCIWNPGCYWSLNEKKCKKSFDWLISNTWFVSARDSRKCYWEDKITIYDGMTYWNKVIWWCYCKQSLSFGKFNQYRCFEWLKVDVCWTSSLISQWRCLCHYVNSLL